MHVSEQWKTAMWLSVCIITGFILWPALVAYTGSYFGLEVELRWWAMALITLLLLPGADNGVVWAGFSLITLFGMVT